MNDDAKELRGMLCWFPALCVLGALMLVDLVFGDFRERKQDDNRPMTKDEHRKRFEVN